MSKQNPTISVNLSKQTDEPVDGMTALINNEQVEVTIH